MYQCGDSSRSASETLKKTGRGILQVYLFLKNLMYFSYEFIVCAVTQCWFDVFGTCSVDLNWAATNQSTSLDVVVGG